MQCLLVFKPFNTVQWDIMKNEGFLFANIAALWMTRNFAFVTFLHSVEARAISHNIYRNVTLAICLSLKSFILLLLKVDKLHYTAVSATSFMFMFFLGGK